MDTIKKLKEAFSCNNQDKKEIMIEEIADQYEFGDLDKVEIIEGTNLLLSQVILEKDEVFKESILHAIHNAIVYHDVAVNVSLDILLPYCCSLSNENLSYVLAFLGFSGDDKYLSTLKKFQGSADKTIRDTVKEAMVEIAYRSSI